MAEVLEFRAKPSYGWLSWSLLGMVVWAFNVPAMLGYWNQFPWWLRLFQIWVVGLGAFFMLIAALQPTMRYRLEPDRLVASFSGLLQYRIPYASIEKLERRDLLWSVWSSVRMPGLALYSVPYRRDGDIKMCSTRVTKGVLVVTTTDGSRYGISPAEEDRFIAELGKRVEEASGRQLPLPQFTQG